MFDLLENPDLLPTHTGPRTWRIIVIIQLFFFFLMYMYGVHALCMHGHICVCTCVGVSGHIYGRM